MKLLVVAHELAPTGPVVQLVELARRWRAMGWKISVLSRGRGTCRAELERLGCEVGETFNVKEYDLALVLTAVQARRVVELAPHVRTVFAIHEGHAFVGNFKGAPDTLAAAFRAAHRILFVHEFQRDILFRPFLLALRIRALRGSEWVKRGG